MSEPRLTCSRCGEQKFAASLSYSRSTEKHFCRDWIGCDARYYAAKAAEERRKTA